MMLDGKSILVAVCDDLCRLSICESLNDFKANVVQAVDAKSFFSSFENKTIDLAIVDMDLADIDGLEVVSKLKERDSDLPVIAFSGTNKPTDIVQAMRAGAWDVMVKPYHRDVLLDSVKRAFEHLDLLFAKKQQREAEAREMRLLEERIRQAQRMESLGTLAGGIAHDFNNLMTVVISNASLLERRNPSEKSSIQSIVSAAKRASVLTQNMLDYSGKGHFPMKTLNLSSVVASSMDLALVSLSDKPKIHVDLSEDKIDVFVDAKQISQIISALAANAAEAMPENGGMISISTGVMNCDRDYLNDALLGAEFPLGKCAYLEISDNGCGIEPEIQQKMFDPFFSTKFIGRGLGLATVIGITRRHKGAVKFTSEVGKGSSFRVLFPLVIDTDASGIPLGTGSRISSIPPPSRGTLLLVDDEEFVRVLGKSMGARLGFDVLTARDGRDALGLFENTPKMFECVILDLVMPFMSGEQCFDELRQIRTDVPVIVSSGYNDQKLLERFLVEQSNIAFLAKPYRLTDFSDTIDKLLC